MADLEHEKRRAAQAAALLVHDGMRVGLGTGSTVAHLLSALADRKLRIRCVATSPGTADAAAALGLRVDDFTGVDRLDIAIDGADQVADSGWLVKGGGGAHVREKLVAVAADRFVVIADSTKPVEQLQPPVPVELLAFGLEATLSALRQGGAGATLRSTASTSPDGGVLADYLGDVTKPHELSAWLDAIPGVVGHGLFPPSMVSDVFIADGDDVTHRRITG